MVEGQKASIQGGVRYSIRRVPGYREPAAADLRTWHQRTPLIGCKAAFHSNTPMAASLRTVMTTLNCQLFNFTKVAAQLISSLSRLTHALLSQVYDAVASQPTMMPDAAQLEAGYSEGYQASRRPACQQPALAPCHAWGPG